MNKVGGGGGGGEDVLGEIECERERETIREKQRDREKGSEMEISEMIRRRKKANNKSLENFFPS